MDNASSHVVGNEKEWIEAVKGVGLPVEIRRQPPSSPDLNVLDLGYFQSIQSLQQRTRSLTVSDLVANVEKSYEELPPAKLTDIFLTWQLVMLKIIENEGDNTYQLPHKRKRERNGLVKTVVVVDDQMIDKVRTYKVERNQGKITSYFEPTVTRSRSGTLVTCLVRDSSRLKLLN